MNVKLRKVKLEPLNCEVNEKLLHNFFKSSSQFTPIKGIAETSSMSFSSKELTLNCSPTLHIKIISLSMCSLQSGCNFKNLNPVLSMKIKINYILIIIYRKLV